MKNKFNIDSIEQRHEKNLWQNPYSITYVADLVFLTCIMKQYSTDNNYQYSGKDHQTWIDKQLQLGNMKPNINSKRRINIDKDECKYCSKNGQPDNGCFTGKVGGYGTVYIHCNVFANVRMKSNWFEINLRNWFLLFVKSIGNFWKLKIWLIWNYQNWDWKFTPTYQISPLYFNFNPAATSWNPFICRPFETSVPLYRKK